MDKKEIRKKIKEINRTLINEDQKLTEAQNDEANFESQLTRYEQELDAQRQMWEKFKSSDGRYIDPYNGSDRTQEVFNIYNTLENNISGTQSILDNVKARISVFQSNKQRLIIDKKSYQGHLEVERNERIQKVKDRIKMEPSRIATDLKKVTKGYFRMFTRMAENPLLDKKLNVTMKDRLTKGRSIIHARNHLREEESGNKLHLHEKKSRLVSSDKSKTKEQLPVRYQKYNSITNTADIDFDKPYQVGVATKRGIEFKTYNSITVQLNDQHKIDFTLPENIQLLKNEKFLTEILKQHPESLSTIPAQYITDQNKEAISQSFEEGYNKNIQDQNFGWDTTGKPLTETQYNENMTKMFTDKKEEVRLLQQSRDNAQQISSGL